MLKKKKTHTNPEYIARPTSPHLQIYRWNLSSLTSIFHRLTGVALFFSVIIISWYIVYYSTQINIENQENCECWVMTIIKNFFTLACVALIFSLYYHFCNGIRHLFWDIGKGFDIKVANRNAMIVILLALALTALTIAAVIYLKFY
ncbi:succinate dehydrogenase cytochrome b556 subunit [Alphaproteobacteria bacterium]|nr:succinate dehydrogenase cytochrome b556 subunit [Alphaproteobacteria bacterium]